MSLFNNIATKAVLAMSLLFVSAQSKADTATHSLQYYWIHYGKTTTYLGTYKHQIYLDVTTQSEPKITRNIALIFMNGKLPANTKDNNRCGITNECFTLFFPVSDYQGFLDVLKLDNKVVNFDPTNFELQIITRGQ